MWPAWPARHAGPPVRRTQRLWQAAACSPGSGRASWPAPRRGRPGRSAPGSPPSRPCGSRVVAVVPRRSSPIRGRRCCAPDAVRARPGGVRVRVVEPVLDVGPPAPPDHVGEDGGPAPRRRSGGRPGPGRRERRAAGVAAAAVVHRQLALSPLVHEPGRVLAHEAGGRRAVGRGERDLPVVAPAARTAHTDPVGQKPAERPAVHQTAPRPRRPPPPGARAAPARPTPPPPGRSRISLGRPYEAPLDGWVTWATKATTSRRATPSRRRATCASRPRRGAIASPGGLVEFGTSRPSGAILLGLEEAEGDRPGLLGFRRVGQRLGSARPPGGPRRRRAS